METLAIFLGDRPQWLRLVDGKRVQGSDRFDDIPQGPRDADRRVVAVMPAEGVMIHHAELAGLSDAQARAAARLMVAEQAITPIEALHVAVGSETDRGDRPVVAAESERIRGALLWLAERGIDPDVILPNLLMPPRPEEGLVAADIDGVRIIRGRNTAFVDDAVLTPLIAGDVPIRTLGVEECQKFVLAAIDNPEVNLRQGQFAKVQSLTIDRALLGRAAWLAAALLLATMSLWVLTIFKLNLAADRLEASNAVVARAALPPGAVVTNSAAQLRDRLAAIGGGSGFLPLAGVAAGAIEATANVEVVTMTFDGSGALKLLVRASSQAELDAVEQRIRAAGLSTTAGPVTMGQARPSREIAVRDR